MPGLVNAGIGAYCLWAYKPPRRVNQPPRPTQPPTLSRTGKYTHTHPFNGPFSRTTRVSRYLTGKTNMDFTEARDSEWLWHQLGHMQVCTLLQTDNHASTPPLSFLQAGCPFCHPTNSFKALEAAISLDGKSVL